MVEHPASDTKRLSILGATGTIGLNTADLIRQNKSAFEIISLTGNNNVQQLAALAKEFGAKFIATANPEKYQDLKNELAGTGIPCAAGTDAIIEAASMETDICMAAIVGVAGLAPTLKALEAAKRVALANKECLVSAGELFMNTTKKYGTELLPVDSEHSAAFQCLAAEQMGNIAKLTLTASGGPFLRLTQEQLQNVTVKQALKHPNWDMGAKISIDSATLMNKGLELIEAKYLFNLSADQLDMVIHPQSIIHCLVSCIDGSVLAQLSDPDMKVPIAYSLAWPHRIKTPIDPIDLAQIGQLTFEHADKSRFPCLRLADEALSNIKVLGPVLNAANEIAVAAFLNEQIPFTAIPEIIESAMEQVQKSMKNHIDNNLNSILQIDQETRDVALKLLNSHE